MARGWKPPVNPGELPAAGGAGASPDEGQAAGEKGDRIMQTAWVNGKKDEPIAITWSETDLGGAAWAEQDKITRAKFTREVRRLFPGKHVTVWGERGEWNAVVVK